MKMLCKRLISVKNAPARWKLIFAVLIVIWACPQSLAETHPAWNQLNLHEVHIAGASVYYEKCF